MRRLSTTSADGEAPPGFEQEGRPKTTRFLYTAFAGMPVLTASAQREKATIVRLVFKEDDP